MKQQKEMKYLRKLILLMAAVLCCTSLSHASEPAKRKKVGLVLSGGGAKGMAHIGVLKVIEEAGIPIDYVVGTSMGGIIGGLYAIGYTPKQMDSMVRRQDWTFLLSDQVVRKEQSMTERDRSERYVLSVPLGKDMGKNISGGLIKGQNIANLFSELTIGYHDSIDFNRLPVPFACVSQDIATGNEVRFHSGILSTAMRASMAIPGVFTPVRLDSMVLVDGGVVNNYPVNVARDMGADIIIGVDVQSELKPAGELTGTGSILGQLIDLMGQDLYKENLKKTDAYIKVDVKGYSAASFTRNAIDTLIRRGKEAALAQKEALMQLKRGIGLADDYRPQTVEAYPFMHDRKVYIRNISFDGLNEKDEKWLLKRCDLKENTAISIDEIEEATSMLTANLEYSTATYTLPKHPDGGYDLHFNLSKKYEQKLNVGLRFDTEETAAVLVNVTHTFRSKMPTTLALTGRLGKRYAARMEYGVEPSPLRRIGLSYTFQYNDIDFSHHNDHRHSNTYRYHQAELSFANVWHRNIRYSLGVRWELYDYDKILYEESVKHPYDVNDERFFAYFAQLHYDSFDNAHFPRRGVSAQASYALYTDDFTKYKGHTPFSAIRGHFGTVFPITRRFSILPDVYGRFLIGKDIPYAKLNCVGGDVAGRYLYQQLPFVGINNTQIVGNALVVGSLKFRQRMGKIHYLTLTGNYALNASKWDNLLKEKALFGCGVGYGMDSMFGPLEASLNYVNHTDKVSLYVNLGYKF